MRILFRMMAMLAALAVAGTASAQTTLKVVMLSDLKILDPIWTTAYIVRDHGYMIYDTLFAVDDKLQVQPQMVDTWKVSDDKFTYTIKDGDGDLSHTTLTIHIDDSTPTDSIPVAGGATTQVFEAGLPPRNVSESPGTNQGANICSAAKFVACTTKSPSRTMTPSATRSC